MRVFALSDVHIDYSHNMAWLNALSAAGYTDDTLILAGDVSDDMGRLETALQCVRARFAHVFFVPGNHDLWVRRSERADSVDRFAQILDLCAALGVNTDPARANGGNGGVWIVPLFSWYTKPEEGDTSLFAPKPGEDPTLRMWSDNYFTAWPSLEGRTTASEYFLDMNEPRLRKRYDAPVISFSHFLPRQDLIFSTPGERRPRGTTGGDPRPAFNFSRVAGCAGIEKQIRQLGPEVHVYGHQHRNRHRTIDGVRYISYCLGYPRERERGQVHGVENGPRLVWDTQKG